MLILAAVTVAFVATLTSLTAGQAHEAPTGWMYDGTCCSGHDCGIDSGKITPDGPGWLIERDGLVIPYKSFIIHRSKDELFHSCWLQGDDTKPQSLLCLYVPPMET